MAVPRADDLQPDSRGRLPDLSDAAAMSSCCGACTVADSRRFGCSATGEDVPYELRISALDRIFNSDPSCAVVIDVSGVAFDDPVPVLEVTFNSPV